MSGKKGKSLYSIGEYARNMGVTPDFLKHYEHHGLLDAEHRGNGYRYFPFEQSAKILECIRLQKYGVTIREMGRMLDDMDGRDAVEKLDLEAASIKKRIERDTALVEEHERFRRWFAEQTRPQALHWEVRRIDPLLFLPHSSGKMFLEDPDVYRILDTWTDWLPVVKSALELPDAASGEEPSWGLIVGEPAALEHGIPVNRAVRRIPGGTAYIHHFAGPGEPGPMEALAAGRHEAFENMAALGLKPAGPVYMVMLMSARRNNAREGYGMFIAPLETSSQT